MKHKLVHVIAMIILLSLTLILTACEKSDEAKYKDAQSLLGKGQFVEAATAFDELGNYEESSKLSMYCKAAAAGEDGDYDTAFSTFELLGDYKDSSMMITYYSARRMEELGGAVETGGWVSLLQAAATYDTIMLFRDSKERSESCRKNTYDQASALAEEEMYSSAVNMFTALGTYSDSELMSKYYYAARLEQQGLYREASNAFAEISDFKDSNSHIDSALQKGYDAALALEEAGDTEGAYVALIELGDYKDAIERACKPYYERGEALLADGDYIEAARMFSKSFCYKDGLKRAWNIRYQYLKYNQFTFNGGGVFAIKADGTVAFAYDNNDYTLNRKSEYQNSAKKYDRLVAIDINCGLRNDGTVIIENSDYRSYNTKKFTEIVQITGLYNEYYGLKANGTVVTSSEDESLNKTLSEWKGIIEVAIGEDGQYVYGLRYDGTVLCARGSKSEIVCRNAVDIKWARDVYYTDGTLVCLLDDGTIYSLGKVSWEFDDFPNWKNIKDIFVGETNIFAVTEDGKLLIDGDNYKGKTEISFSGSIGYMKSDIYYTFVISTGGTLFYAGETKCIDFSVFPRTIGSSLTLE